MPSPTRDTITRGLLSNFSLHLLYSLLQIAALAVLARILRPSEFGYFAAFTMVISFAQMFSDIGVGPALIQTKEINREVERASFYVASATTSVVAIIFYALVPTIAAAFAHPEWQPGLAALTILLPLQGISITAYTMLLRQFRSAHAILVEIASVFVGSLLSIALALQGAGYWALIHGAIAQGILRVILLYGLTRHALLPKFGAATILPLLHKSVRVTINRIAMFAALNGDNIVIARYLSATDLGIYSRSYTLAMKPSQFYNRIVNQLIFPTVAALEAEPERLRKMHRKGTALSTLITLPISIWSFVLAPELVSILLGPQWRAAAPVFQALSVGMFFRLSYKVNSTVLLGLSRTTQLTASYLSYAALVVIGCYLLRTSGMVAMAWWVTIATALNFLWSHVLAARAVGDQVRALNVSVAQALPLGVVAAVSCSSLAWLSRAWGAPDWLAAIGVSAGFGAASVAAALLSPRLFLGSDGLDFVLGAIEKAPLRRWRGWIKRRARLSIP